MNRFNPDKVVATPGALVALEASGESFFDYFTRYMAGATSFKQIVTADWAAESQRC